MFSRKDRVDLEIQIKELTREMKFSKNDVFLTVNCNRQLNKQYNKHLRNNVFMKFRNFYTNNTVIHEQIIGNCQSAGIRNIFQLLYVRCKKHIVGLKCKPPNAILGKFIGDTETLLQNF